jgi:hypothetical protein
MLTQAQLEEFERLKKERDANVEAVTHSMQPDTANAANAANAAKGTNGLPVAGWYELVRELEIQHALGRL